VLTSLVIPVFRNASGIADLVMAVESLAETVGGPFEAGFVVDGCPDDSLLQLSRALPEASFDSQLIALSRNFGSFSAVRAGMDAAKGEIVVVMSADLQEPPSLVLELVSRLQTGNWDVAVGQRVARADASVAADLFWWLYRRLVMPEIPKGGADIFGCTSAVRDQIMRLQEGNSSLIGLLFWVGYRRCLVPYERRPRPQGKSAWTLKRKLTYLSDSVFSFSDLPIRLLTRVGLLGLLVSVVFSIAVLVWRLAGETPVPGYAATVLIVTFFGALNLFGLGVIGSYVWRTFENTKGRPEFIVRWHEVFGPGRPSISRPGDLDE
jgi:glycosyltransferase involved in cell wall biosynthesis